MTAAANRVHSSCAEPHIANTLHLHFDRVVTGIHFHNAAWLSKGCPPHRIICRINPRCTARSENHGCVRQDLHLHPNLQHLRSLFAKKLPKELFNAVPTKCLPEQSLSSLLRVYTSTRETTLRVTIARETAVVPAYVVLLPLLRI
eukprot:CAMPEP_0179013524 /NCGR_PEP_ID=MMETSP0796-20121207/1770_1 /TAXON_ID=73915 /ORGANISM="Pyrodinium bahamense, Strain pbaha01" /LENGTH=144 /DNA_ID=CAMNT_0020709029 /DNA_START=251 /DNA_END=685 /DNA_ORIENTATION=+